MRPIRLQMSGFSAFREPTTVDFTDVDVMAFVGATGSGKSSIIDAVTFALYGSVARYGEKDVAPVVNQLSTEARVRLDFEIGGLGYTVVRVVRRTKSGATTKEARLERGGDILAGDARGVTTAIEGLLGLTFERFNKTVVLPQGRFAEFLHDKPAQRQELLRELLGLGIYERIGQLARQRARDADSYADVLRRQLAAGSDLSAERHSRLMQRLGDIRHARQQVGDVAGRAEALSSSHLAVVQALETTSAHLALVDSIGVPEGTAQLGGEITRARERLTATTLALASAREQRRLAEEAAGAGPSIVAMEVVLQQHRRYAELAGRLSVATDELADAAIAHEAAQHAATKFSNHTGSLRGAVVGAKAIHRQAIEAIEGHPDQPSLDALVRLHHQLDNSVAELSEARAAAAEASRAAAEARLTSNAAQARLEHLQQLAPAASLARLLRQGDACPVCEQPVLTLPPRRIGVDDALFVAQQAADRARSTLMDAETAGGAAAGVVTALLTTAERLSEQLTSAPPIGEVRRQLSVLSDLRSAESEARSGLRQAEAVLAEVESSRETRDILESERTAERRLTAASTTAEHLTTDLATAAAALTGAPDEAEAAAELARARALEETRTAASTGESEAEILASQSLRQFDALQQRETAARNSFAATRDRLAHLSPPAATADLAADWLELARWSRAAAAAWRLDIDELTQQRHQLVTAIDTLISQARHLAAPFADASGQGIGPIRELLAAAEARSIAEFAQFERERDQAAILRTELTARETDAQVAVMLGDLLRSTKFERWLLDEALSDLVDRATVRLRELTGGQYSLIAHAGSFRICDHRNADEIRDARSLSGGETFLASLALALALADSAMDLAAEGTAPLESIFLDEGFGTLDPDTLDIVAATIEELGASGRMVGIVTHIRELAERMPVRFEVTKGASTSTVARVEQ